jgi:hypothetical protein
VKDADYERHYPEDALPRTAHGESVFARLACPNALPDVLEEPCFPDALRRAAALEYERRPRRARFIARALGLYLLLPATEDRPGVHRDQLRRALRTQRSDVAKLVQWLRRSVPGFGQTLVSGQEGYRFSLSPERCPPWESGNVEYSLTRMETTRLGMEPYNQHVEEHGTAEQKRLVAALRRDFARVIEDLAALR